MVAVQRNVRVNPERWDKSQRTGEAGGGAIQIHLAHCSAIYHWGLTSMYVVCAAYLGTGMKYSEENGFPLPRTDRFYELGFIYYRQDTQKYFDPQNFIEIGVGSWSCAFLGMTSERGGLVAVCWDSLHCPNLDFSMKHLVFCKQQPNHKVTFVSNDNSNRTLQKGRYLTSWLLTACLQNVEGHNTLLGHLLWFHNRSGRGLCKFPVGSVPCRWVVKTEGPLTKCSTFAGCKAWAKSAYRWIGKLGEQ